MLAFRKNGERRVGQVVQACGGGLAVDQCNDDGSVCRVLVQSSEAEDREAFKAEWRRVSPLARRAWQTEDGAELPADELLS